MSAILEELQYISPEAGDCSLVPLCTAHHHLPLLASTHTRAHVSGKQTNKQTHKLVNTSANPNPCVDYFWAHSHMNPPLRRTLSFRFSLFFTPAVSCSCISSKQPAASLFLSLHCHSSPFISSHTFSILFPSPRLWPISPIIKQWTGGLMECCCMKCWQDR